jgi:hypothetical protein
MLRAAAEATVEPDFEIACSKLRQAIASADSGIEILLQLTGLTRTKVLTDLRAAAGASRSTLRIPSSHRGLTGSTAVWAVAGPYLLARARAVLAPIAGEGATTFAHAAEALNQATWPGYIRQERAKRSGHEAEARVATLLRTLEIPFAPEEKADNPLVPDVIIGGVSFDIVVPDAQHPRIVVKSTVHTSNIGQFGESKDALEMSEAKAWIQTLPAQRRPMLFAFIDGIGFRSNRAGLDGVLTSSDEFCQFKTIWKVAVVAAAATGARLELVLPTDDIAEHQIFLRRWQDQVDLHAVEDTDSTAELVVAGAAFLRLIDE